MQLLIATRNDHKLQEIRALFANTSLTILDLRSVPEAPEELPEHGNTFVANALEKARFIYELTGRIAVADDSGIEVDALGGAPGVFSKRFSPEGTDEANNAYLMQRLAGNANRRARYRCVIAVVGPEGEATAEGVCEGRIVESPRGRGGFGYDPYFLPDEFPGRTMAELSMAEKNTISHRGRAFTQLPGLLTQFFSEAGKN